MNQTSCKRRPNEGMKKKINNKTFGGSPSLIVITSGKKKKDFHSFSHFLIYCCVLFARRAIDTKFKAKTRDKLRGKQKFFFRFKFFFVFFFHFIIWWSIKNKTWIYFKEYFVNALTLIYGGFFYSKDTLFPVMDNTKSVNITTDLLLE